MTLGWYIRRNQVCHPHCIWSWTWDRSSTVLFSSSNSNIKDFDRILIPTSLSFTSEGSTPESWLTVYLDMSSAIFYYLLQIQISWTIGLALCCLMVCVCLHACKVPARRCQIARVHTDSHFTTCESIYQIKSEQLHTFFFPSFIGKEASHSLT